MPPSLCPRYDGHEAPAMVLSEPTGIGEIGLKEA
jgi:hypothetical protein